MSVSVVAKLLGVHINTIYNYINIGKVEATKVGGTWQISEEEFLRLKREQRRTPRIAIESLTLSIELIEYEIVNNTNLKKIDDCKELEITKKRLEHLRSYYYKEIERGTFEMDKSIDLSIYQNVALWRKGDLD